ncbi:uncharacterized protein LOC121394995 [Xenopus laevis]|uniref:Uncharacterized protein LOC121394995 n=1 Tax=Xenopus laevis TaxID=8355 RepID=A0A8J1L1D7_XENLA|nr:uncharacterized protein LOC121394995 [Xenopus laevis]
MTVSHLMSRAGRIHYYQWTLLLLDTSKRISFFQKNICEGRGRPSCPAVMGPTSLPSLFIIIIGLIQIFFGTTSGFKVEKFTLFKPKLIFKANTMGLIPCKFHTRRPLNPLIVELEWGFIPVGEDKYKPLIHLYGDHIRLALHEYKDKYQVFKSLVAKGNCSLVINPTDIKDSGIYQVKLKIKEKVFTPPSSIKITIVKHEKVDTRTAKHKTEATTALQSTAIMETTATPPDETDFIEDTILPSLTGNEKMFGIIVICVASPLALYAVIGIVICVAYNRKKKKGHTGDVENPPVEDSNAGKEEKAIDDKDESEEISSDTYESAESAESASDSADDNSSQTEEES